MANIHKRSAIEKGGQVELYPWFWLKPPQILLDKVYKLQNRNQIKVQTCMGKIQGVSKKRYFCDFLSYFSSRGRILLFHMCFRIRILSPFHLAIQKKNHVRACVFSVFRTVKILNGYFLNS